jgi:hypothetical protein
VTEVYDKSARHLDAVRVTAVLRHDGGDGYISVRASTRTSGNPFRISPTSLRGGLKFSFDVLDELDEAEEVVDVVFPADEDATLPLDPGEEALDQPTSHVTA